MRSLKTIYKDRAFVFSDDFSWLDSSRLQLASVARRLETGNELETRPATRSFTVRHRFLELRPSVIERLPLGLRFGLFLLLATWGLWRKGRALAPSVGGFAIVLGLAGLVNAASGFLADAW